MPVDSLVGRWDVCSAFTGHLQQGGSTPWEFTLAIHAGPIVTDVIQSMRWTRHTTVGTTFGGSKGCVEDWCSEERRDKFEVTSGLTSLGKTTTGFALVG